MLRQRNSVEGGRSPVLCTSFFLRCSTGRRRGVCNQSHLFSSRRGILSIYSCHGGNSWPVKLDIYPVRNTLDPSVTPPPLHGVRGLEAADQKAVEEGREGLWVEASKSTGGTEVVERGGHRGSARVLKGHPGWVLDGVPGSWEASGGRPRRWGGRGRAGTALETSFLFSLSFVFLSPVSLGSRRGGVLGSRRAGCPGLTLSELGTG